MVSSCSLAMGVASAHVWSLGPLAITFSVPFVAYLWQPVSDRERSECLAQLAATKMAYGPSERRADQRVAGEVRAR